MLSLENTASRMSHLARQEIYFDRQFGLDETLDGVSAVTAGDVQREVRLHRAPVTEEDGWMLTQQGEAVHGQRQVTLAGRQSGEVDGIVAAVEDRALQLGALEIRPRQLGVGQVDAGQIRGHVGAAHTRLGAEHLRIPRLHRSDFTRLLGNVKVHMVERDGIQHYLIFENLDSHEVARSEEEALIRDR